MRLFSGHNLATYHKAVHRSYTSWPSDPNVIYKTSVQSWGMHGKQNFERVLGFKSDFYFSLSLLPSPFASSASFFFLLLSIW